MRKFYILKIAIITDMLNLDENYFTMSQGTSGADSLNEFENSKLPSSLNVLTILTIIACCLFFIGEIYGFVTAKKSYEETKQLIESGKLDEAPGFVKGMVNENTLKLQKKRMENKMPIMVLGVVGLGLCFYGALEMRKRKKQGYTFWLIGELLPFVTTFIFIGASAFSGMGLLYCLFPLIFIILYTVNRKHLVY